MADDFLFLTFHCLNFKLLELKMTKVEGKRAEGGWIVVADFHASTHPHVTKADQSVIIRGVAVTETKTGTSCQRGTANGN